MDASSGTVVRGSCLESYRINMTARVWPYIVPATILVSLGALGVCMAFVTHGPLEPYASTITIVGAAGMLAGLLLTLMVAKPVLSHDEYVAALEGGMLWKLDGEESFLAWADVADVQWDAERAAVVIRPRDGEPVVIARPFGRGPGDQVAARLDEVRRKVGFHLM